VALLGRPTQSDSDWAQYVGVLGHPLIWLFFGGFVLAAAMERCGLDRRLALGLLRRVGDRYQNVLLGTMLATFVLSMFMSNTATTAMMLAVLAPVLLQFGTNSNTSKGLVLGIAVAANLGGMGSLIGTPPNAIAVAALAKLEPPQVITFLDWMIVGFPPAMAAMLLIWGLLLWMHPDPGREIRLEVNVGENETSDPATWQFLVVSGSLLATIGLWLTSSWHGIPTAAVSFLPIVLLTSTGVLSAKDIRGLNYDVLFLMAGGLALGNVVTSTGLSDWIVARLPVEFLGPVGLAFVMAYVTVILSNFMSNTAAANILIPLVVTMAAGFEATVAIAVALGASSAMCLPVATPPNAMVFATGRLQTWDLVRVGLVVGLIAPAIGLAWLAVCLKLIL
jgi:sodium-dependent dicarboxylate transporter 2/3/5